VIRNHNGSSEGNIARRVPQIGHRECDSESAELWGERLSKPKCQGDRQDLRNVFIQLDCFSPRSAVSKAHGVAAFTRTRAHRGSHTHTRGWGKHVLLLLLLLLLSAIVVVWACLLLLSLAKTIVFCVPGPCVGDAEALKID